MSGMIPSMAVFLQHLHAIAIEPNRFEHRYTAGLKNKKASTKAGFLRSDLKSDYADSFGFRT